VALASDAHRAPRVASTPLHRGSLRTNAIGDAGAQALAVTLPLCPTLTVLEYATGRPMLHAIQRDTSRRSPRTGCTCVACTCLGSLSVNQIGAAGMQALAAALPSCPALAELK